MRAKHLTQADVEMIVTALRDRAYTARRAAAGWMPNLVRNKEAVAAIFIRQANHAERLATLLEGADIDVYRD
jgi:hypothetical protein